jgi:hypothetical protein
MGVKTNKAVARIRTQDVASDWSMKGKTVLFTGAPRQRAMITSVAGAGSGRKKPRPVSLSAPGLWYLRLPAPGGAR